MQDIKSGRLFGYVQCDLKVSEHLRAYFANLPPIFKNTVVSRNDIGLGGGPFSALGSSGLAIAYLNTWGPPPPALISSHSCYSVALKLDGMYDKNLRKSIFLANIRTYLKNIFISKNCFLKKFR